MKLLFANIFLVLLRVLSLLPLRLLYVFSRILYFLMYYIFRYRLTTVRENLQAAFPELPEKARRGIERRFYMNFSDFFAESLKALSASEKKMRKRMTFVNPEVVHRYYSESKSVVIVQGHCFNWEWTLMLGPPECMHERRVIYRPLSSRLFDHVLEKLRRRFGAETIPTYKIHETIQRGEGSPAMYHFGADQSPMKHKAEFWMNFLNRDAPVYLGAANVACAGEMPLVFLDVRKVARGKYEVEYFPLCDDPQTCGPYELTERHVRVLEEVIRLRPDSWLWSHRRWKHRRN